jgi:membrane protease YdiL (CAAX protease family)
MRSPSNPLVLVLRIAEFLLLFFGIPLLIYFDREFIHPSMLILPLLAFIFIVLRRTTTFEWKELVRWGITSRQLWQHGTIVLITFLVMLAAVILFDRRNLFNLPLAHPWIFLALSLFYPAFSAFGQEVIYRTFLYRRYRVLFPKPWHFILVSGITFSFMHIVYYDPVSMILTLIGGLYFAYVYHQTRSVLFSAVLHGCMGIIVFAVGLGQYFWLDMPV